MKLILVLRVITQSNRISKILAIQNFRTIYPEVIWYLGKSNDICADFCSNSIKIKPKEPKMHFLSNFSNLASCLSYTNRIDEISNHEGKADSQSRNRLKRFFSHSQINGMLSWVKFWIFSCRRVLFIQKWITASQSAI